MNTDIIGSRFNKLIVLEHVNRVKGNKAVLCRCDCGKEKIIMTHALKNETVKSCGCLALEKKTIHGKSKTREFVIWSGIIQRCYNPNNKSYCLYGAKGIVVCQRWKTSFLNFISDVGPAPTSSHSADRFPDKNGNYELDNFRWATSVQQARNRNSNVYFEYGGLRFLLIDWASIFKVKSSNVKQHLKTKSFEEIYLFYKRKNKFNEKTLSNAIHI